jgi:hypothetical protein
VRRILEAYQSGETYRTEAFKKKVYKSHSRVPEAADDFFEV